MAVGPWAKLAQLLGTDAPETEKPRKKSPFPTASTESRTIYVNTEIAPDKRDDYNQPIQTYCSNKIRTAKYTWYTFLPKNLFEQFRGIANLYFLFLVILQMFPLFSTSASPVLVVLPLAAILILTGAKDAFEDNKRHKTDQSVNKSVTYTIADDWTNVNVPVYKVSLGRRWLNSIGKFIKRLFGFGKPKSDDLNALSRVSTMRSEYLPTSPSNKTLALLRKLKRKRKGPYRPGKIPHSVLRRSVLPSSSAAGKESKKNHKSAPHQPLDRRWRKTRWQDLRVGDFVYLRNNDAVPADIAVLSTSEVDGLCYVETQNLDGETNLKIMRALQATSEIRTVDDCKRSKFYIESEPPHANLYTYNGVLKWKVEMGSDGDGEDDSQLEPKNTLSPKASSSLDTGGADEINDDEDDDDDDDDSEVSHEKTEAITSSSVLLRGCVIRNTDWVIGIVLFTGIETKIMLNSGKTPSKRSKMEKATNPHVIANFVLLFILCVICSIAASIVYNSHTSSDFFETKEAESATLEGFIMFWTTLVIYQNIIPISLYISVQIVKTAAAYFIHTDLELYNERLDQPCIPKTWNISDDLGQIEYIFSDKTGTLTQNIMEFRRCTINGVSYGLGETEASIGAKKRDNPNMPDTTVADAVKLEKARDEMMEKQTQLFEHKYANPKSSFIDPKLYDDLAENNEQSQSVVHFFSALALCHTVIPELPDPDNEYDIIYKAQSPDEAALVATARDVGFAFVARETDNVIINALGELRQFTLLNVLEFNSTRKRMSVIMRSPLDGSIVLLCKGADSVIYERLSKDLGESDADKEQKRIREQTLEHLGTFANEGLRTLCIASRMLADTEYEEWNARYKIAASSIRNRDEQIENVCEEIEQNLSLIGGTAIEDKLQEGVPETIGVLAEAGIKIWVLTGDKIETAINIGFACNLLTKDMLLISVSARDEEETMRQLKKSQAEVREKSSYQKCALVIDGESLKYALEPPCKNELLELGTMCMAVVCCRVSPMQKAKVVNLVKKGLKVMTLAIGDGANDVSMIQEANVGIGISGEEGRQAVMASDYAIAQFRYLSKLLLVHGRWSYLRTSEMILTFFYKNIMWTLVLFWYQLFCGFSGTMMFDYSYITLYNLVFTSLPCIFAGVLDQDLSSKFSYKYPQLYLMGIRDDKFHYSRFYLTVLDAIYQSAVCFAVPYMLFIEGKMSSNGYDTEGVYELGTFIAGIAVVVANALVGFTIFSWTWVMVAVIGISSATFFLWTGVYAQVKTFNFYGEDILFHQGGFWLCLLITFVICMLPRYATKYVLHMDKPFDNDIIRETVLCKSTTRFSRRKIRGAKQRLEEEVPIALARTHSETSTAFRTEATDDLYDDENAYALTENKLTRTNTNASTRTEIMNMGSGVRSSFMGFAYSSDDKHPFEDYRQSVYRQSSVSSRHASALRARLSVATLASSVNAGADDTGGGSRGRNWMPMGGFHLRRYDTAPDVGGGDHRGRKSGGLRWKMMHAMKQRISPKPPSGNTPLWQHRRSSASEATVPSFSSQQQAPPQRRPTGDDSEIGQVRQSPPQPPSSS